MAEGNKAIQEEDLSKSTCEGSLVLFYFSILESTASRTSSLFFLRFVTPTVAPPPPFSLKNNRGIGKRSSCKMANVQNLLYCIVLYLVYLYCIYYGEMEE